MTLPPTAIIWEALRDQIGPAFGITFLVVAVAGKRFSTVATVMALLLSFALCNYLGRLNPDWFPQDKRVHWLPWLTIVAAVAGGLISSSATRLGQILLATVVATLAVRVLPKDYHLAPMWALPAFVGFTLGNAQALLRIADRSSRWLATLVAATALLTAGVVVIFAHSKSLMDVANIGGVMLTALALLTMVRPCDVTPALPAAAVLLSGVLVAGFHETYSELPPITFSLPALAPFTACLGTLLPRRRTLFILILGMIPLIAAVIVAFRYETLEFDT